jgi:hypothetical protein
MRPASKGLYIDVGTAAQTMLLAAHSLGLGSGIVTSFSQAAVSEVLNLPEHLSPEMFVCLGYAAPVQPPAKRDHLAELDRLGAFSVSRVTSSRPDGRGAPSCRRMVWRKSARDGCTSRQRRRRPLQAVVTIPDQGAIIKPRDRWCRSTNSTPEDTAMPAMPVVHSTRPAPERALS